MPNPGVAVTTLGSDTTRDSRRMFYQVMSPVIPLDEHAVRALGCGRERTVA
jgi:hypothetical protein